MAYNVHVGNGLNFCLECEPAGVEGDWPWPCFRQERFRNVGGREENVQSEPDADAGRDMALRVSGERLCQPVCCGL